MVWFQLNIACRRKWDTYLTEILNNHIPHPYKSNFRKGSFVMFQNVIIRPKIDFSNKADNCYSDHVLTWQVSRQKLQANARVHWPLNRERVSLFGLERSESNYFCTVISKILVKENIFYFMANPAARWIALLSHAYVQIGYRSIHTVGTHRF